MAARHRRIGADRWSDNAPKPLWTPCTHCRSDVISKFRSSSRAQIRSGHRCGALRGPLALSGMQRQWPRSHAGPVRGRQRSLVAESGSERMPAPTGAKSTFTAGVSPGRPQANGALPRAMPMHSEDRVRRADVPGCTESAHHWPAAPPSLRRGGPSTGRVACRCCRAESVTGAVLIDFVTQLFADSPICRRSRISRWPRVSRPAGSPAAACVHRRSCSTMHNLCDEDAWRFPPMPARGEIRAHCLSNAESHSRRDSCVDRRHACSSSDCSTSMSIGLTR